MERSGHSCEIYDNYMIVFGGIFEITKELNDVHLFDFKKSRWITLFEETSSPRKVFNDGYSGIGDDTSPTLAHGTSTYSPKKS